MDKRNLEVEKKIKELQSSPLKVKKEFVDGIMDRLREPKPERSSVKKVLQKHILRSMVEITTEPQPKTESMLDLYKNRLNSFLADLAFTIEDYESPILASTNFTSIDIKEENYKNVILYRFRKECTRYGLVDQYGDKFVTLKRRSIQKMIHDNIRPVHLFNFLKENNSGTNDD